MFCKKLSLTALAVLVGVSFSLPGNEAQASKEMENLFMGIIKQGFKEHSGGNKKKKRRSTSRGRKPKSSNSRAGCWGEPVSSYRDTHDYYEVGQKVFTCSNGEWWHSRILDVNSRGQYKVSYDGSNRHEWRLSSWIRAKSSEYSGGNKKKKRGRHWVGKNIITKSPNYPSNKCWDATIQHTNCTIYGRRGYWITYPNWDASYNECVHDGHITQCGRGQ